MKVYKPGTKVKTKIGGIKGMITGVLIRINEIEYSIRYINQGVPEICWLLNFEIELDIEAKAGFNRETIPEENNEITLSIETKVLS